MRSKREVLGSAFRRGGAARFPVLRGVVEGDSDGRLVVGLVLELDQKDDEEKHDDGG